MIKNSLLVFGILLAGHVAIIGTFFTKADPEDYEEANLVLGRQFLSGADHFDCVIVGSSMGAKIDVNEMPQQAFNLSFTGRGALDGLRLIQHSGTTPAVVLVELNTIYRGESIDFTTKLTNPYLRILSRGSHEMPVNYLVEFSAYLKRRLSGGHASPPASSADQQHGLPAKNAIEANLIAANLSAGENGDKLEDSAFTKIIQSNIDTWQSLPDYYPLEENLVALEEYIESFAQRGILVIFFEMPCHPAIATSPRFQIIRESIQGHAQLNTVPVIAVNDVTEYHSNDGLHLTFDSRGRFSSFLADQIDRHVSERSQAD